MSTERHPRYRKRVMQAVADDGEFVILHWLKRTPDEPQSEIGPTRTAREDIQQFFAPEFKERFFAVEVIEGLTESVGGSMAQGYYWFKRAPADGSPLNFQERDAKAQAEVAEGIEKAVSNK